MPFERSCGNSLVDIIPLSFARKAPLTIFRVFGSGPESDVVLAPRDPDIQADFARRLEISFD